MKNVYYVGSGELTFELIERIINENLKLELAPEAKERIHYNKNRTQQAEYTSAFHYRKWFRRLLPYYL